MKNKKMKKIILSFLAFAVLSFANAEKVAKAIRNGDSRLREIVYNPAEVTRIDTHYGIATALIFHKDETILSSSVGDADAWELNVANNTLMIKPLVLQPFSNLIVQTNLHIYHFVLDTLATDVEKNKAPFMISFKYPTYENEKKKKLAKIKAAKRKKLRENSPIRKKFNPDAHFSKNRDIANVDYFYRGDDSLKPTFMYDDNTHTYIHFLKNQPRPAVYSILNDGKESLINRNDVGDWVVVQGVYKELRLRVGKSVLALINDSYNPLIYKREAQKTKEKRFIKRKK